MAVTRCESCLSPGMPMHSPACAKCGYEWTYRSRRPLIDPTIRTVTGWVPYRCVVCRRRTWLRADQVTSGADAPEAGPQQDVKSVHDPTRFQLGVKFVWHDDRSLRCIRRFLNLKPA